MLSCRNFSKFSFKKYDSHPSSLLLFVSCFWVTDKKYFWGLFYCKLAFYETAHIKLFLETGKGEIPMICSGVSSLAHDL